MKKLFTSLLTMVLILSLIPVIKTEAAYKIFKIKTEKEWNQFANNVNNGSKYEGYVVVLTKDLDFEDKDFVMVKTMATIFDGQGHTIKNIFSTEDIAIFESVSGTVRNLYVDNIIMYGSGAGICKFLVSGTINNCHVLSGTINQKRNRESCGGITRKMDGNAKIINCSNNATVFGNRANTGYNHIGGITGYGLKDCTITNCFNTGEIVGDFWGTSYSGGIAGGFDGIIYSSYNTGNITAKDPNAEDDVNYGNTAAISAHGGTAVRCHSLSNKADNTINSADQIDIVQEHDEKYMKSKEFVDELNAHLREGARKWVYTSNSYPLLDDTISKLNNKIKGKTSYSVYSSPYSSRVLYLNLSAKTDLSYKVISGKNSIAVNKYGVVTIKRNAKVGTCKILVTAKKNIIYKSAKKTIKIKIKK